MGNNGSQRHNDSFGVLPGVIVSPSELLPELEIAFRTCSFLALLLCERSFSVRILGTWLSSFYYELFLLFLSHITET